MKSYFVQILADVGGKERVSSSILDGAKFTEAWGRGRNSIPDVAYSEADQEQS